MLKKVLTSFATVVAFASLTFAATAAHANGFLDFTIPGSSPGGTLTYNGAGGPLIAMNVVITTVEGNSTPLHPSPPDPPLAITNGRMNFTTGAETNPGDNVWKWGANNAPGSVVITGGIAALGIPNGTALMTGTINGAAIDTQFGKVVVAGFVDTKDDRLLEYFGLPTGRPYFGNMNFGIETSAAPGTAINITNGMNITSGDVKNFPTPEPGTVLLLGSGLVGLTYLVRRRKRG